MAVNTHWNTTEDEVREIRSLARRGLEVTCNIRSVRCNQPSHEHSIVHAVRSCETVYRAALLVGPWLETGTGDLCSHNHRSDEAAHACGARFLKVFEVCAPNENWRNE